MLPTEEQVANCLVAVVCHCTTGPAARHERGYPECSTARAAARTVLDLLDPPEEFAFTEPWGRHIITVTGSKRRGVVHKIKVLCETCREILLDATKPSLEMATAAVENHG